MKSPRIYFYLILITQFYISFSEDVNSLESVPDLEQSMYLTVDGFPCVRLLNLSGEIGCANPGRENVVAPVVKLKDVDKVTGPSAVLVTQEEMQDFFIRVLNDKSFAKNIAGVLVESKTKISMEEGGFSPVEKFPQAQFASYKNVSYEWNPTGSNIMLNKYNFPVILVSQDSTSVLQKMAEKNENSKNAYTLEVAEFDVVMQTTKAGTHDSESCLKQQTCLPLGGYSVLSSLPPINTITEQTMTKPIILAVASMDSASFFRDKSPGADSPLSGMISLLAAVDALSKADVVNDLNKQLVFLVFTGESWGYLGSRRFLAELEANSDSVRGLNSTLIEQVVEVGSVGKALDHGINSFFIHTAGAFTSNNTLNAFQDAHKSLGSTIKISAASKSNPGLPPSSLMSFLHKNSSISGFVLEDFDTSFTNKFYHSHLDDLSNVNSSAIVTAASLIARTLYTLASDNSNLNTKTLDSIIANSSLVDELLGCLLTCDPGLSCGLVTDYISSTSTCPNTYTGVLLGEPSSTPYNDYVNDISRFLWNFLAEKTSTPSQNVNSCSQNCGKGEVCVRSEKKGKDTCVLSTTSYVPAYSTRLKFESGVWNVLPQDTSDKMGMVDPIWTESFWDVLQLRVYTVQDAAYDHFVLAAGIAVTLLACVGVVITRAVVTKALKRD
ncbi:hypothetical protein ACHQM5_005503 [Ranunculus cassubicifolius]